MHNYKSAENRRKKTRYTVAVALFCALAYLCVFVFRIKVEFLTFDAKDAVMTIGALYFGPVSAIVMSAIVSFFEYITVSDTGVYGLIMNFLSSAAFTLTASLIYKYKKDLLGAVAGLLSAVFSMTAVMLLANIVITPIYTGMPTGEVVKLIPGLLLPFNLTKACLNAGLVLLLYKPVSLALKKAGFIKGEYRKFTFDGRSIAVTVSALAIIVASIICYIFVLGGSFA